MKKIKLLLMSLMTLFVWASNTGCADDVVDAIMGNDEYFIALDEVNTNLVDASGNNLAQSFYDAFMFDKGGKSQSLGKSDAAPIKAFEQSCENIKNLLQTELNGNLPEGGYVSYTFSLRKDSSSGNVEMTKTITIR